MTTTGDVEQALGDLAGALIGPGHPDYDAARRVYNGMIDKSPALIAQVRTEADVALAVNVARRHGLLLAVRGGGHNGGGLGTCDGGLVIDLAGTRLGRGGSRSQDGDASAAAALGGRWTRRPARTGWPPRAGSFPRPVSAA